MIVSEKEKLADLTSHKPLLIMLPFAGGNIYSYGEIIKLLQYNFDILCPELPGRGSLSHEPFITDLRTLTEHVYLNWIKPLNLKRPYIIFGHSMGALMAYLLAHRLMQEQTPMPMRLIACGREGPTYIDDEAPIFALPALEFREKIRERGGTFEEVLNNDELMDYFEPILRADCEAVETYFHTSLEILDIPITVFYGSEEDMTLESLLLWKKESKRQVDIRVMPGDHFFIFDNVKQISSYLISLIKFYG